MGTGRRLAARPCAGRCAARSTRSTGFEPSRHPAVANARPSHARHAAVPDRAGARRARPGDPRTEGHRTRGPPRLGRPRPRLRRARTRTGGPPRRPAAVAGCGPSRSSTWHRLGVERQTSRDHPPRRHRRPPPGGDEPTAPNCSAACSPSPASGRGPRPRSRSSRSAIPMPSASATTTCPTRSRGRSPASRAGTTNGCSSCSRRSPVTGAGSSA